MKRILLLGGSAQQIPAVEYAKKQGYYTILCDYLPDNPGQYYSDKYHCVSTTDKEKILDIAREEKIDGIIAYASDPAAPTAAFVAESLGLPTNPFDSVEILAYKDKFRLFLKNNNFNCPKANSYNDITEVMKDINEYNFPVMIKPIDSSGSKGVSKVSSARDYKEASEFAFEQSRNGKIIIEEFIVQDHEFMIGGDCFVLNGKVVYWGLLNCHRSKFVNPLVPVGKSYPLLIGQNRIEKVKNEIQRVVDTLGLKFGGFNLEIMVDKNDKVFFIEMGPRNGGNMIPDFLKVINHVDLVEATIESALGNENYQMKSDKNEGFYGTHNIHSSVNGNFVEVQFDKVLNEKIINKVIYKKQGDSINYFDGSNKAIGILFLQFNSQKEQQNIMGNIEKYIHVILEEGKS